MLIAKITESDFFGGEPQYIDDDARYNTRGVMTDGEGNIAMMKIEDSKYYKLPGGSIEITETPDKASILFYIPVFPANVQASQYHTCPILSLPHSSVKPCRIFS